MALSDWQSDDGKKIFKAKGWPEWPGWGNYDYQLRHDEPDRWYVYRQDAPLDNWPTPHVILCIIRDWARELLAARRICVALYECPKYDRWGAFDYRNMRRIVLPTHDDYDAALIAAILATMEVRDGEEHKGHCGHGGTRA